MVATQAGLSLAVLSLVALALASKSAVAADVPVEVGNFYFCSISFHNAVCETDITIGDTVTWSVDGGRHTVTECTSDFVTCPPALGFDSSFLDAGQTFSQTFDTPGTYYYHCNLHKNEMKGTIVVSAPTTPSPTLEQATATEAPTISPTTAALPKTGGAPSGVGASVWHYALLALGAALLAGSGTAFAIARKR